MAEVIATGVVDPRTWHPPFREFPTALQDIGFVLRRGSPVGERGIAQFRQMLQNSFRS